MNKPIINKQNEYDQGDLFVSKINFLGIPPPSSDFASARVVILPVPYDATAEWHRGSRFAPKGIIEASDYLEYYDVELDRESCEVGIHTLPFIKPDLASPEKTVEIIYEATKKILQHSKFIISIGGEHTISLGLVQAYREKYSDLCVLHLDAHADMRDEYNGRKICQATVMRRIYDICPVVQVGVRSLSLEEHQFIEGNQIPTFIYEKNNLNIANIQRSISYFSKNIYLTIDMDVFDPSVMPAVGTPEPGGLMWNEILDIIKMLSTANNIVGVDLVELCPSEGSAACAYTAAKLIYKIIGYCIK